MAAACAPPRLKELKGERGGADRPAVATEEGGEVWGRSEGNGGKGSTSSSGAGIW